MSNQGQAETKDLARTKAAQPEKDLGVEQRLVPSQAEGDPETIEEDLKRKNPPAWTLLHIAVG